MEYMITEEKIMAFSNYLVSMEKSTGTVDNYIRNIRRFFSYICGSNVSKECVNAWKHSLMEQNYQTATINAMLVAVNCFLKWSGHVECCVKTLRIQKKMFRDESRELTRAEYEKLINTARARNQERLALMIETICSTGIRVGELRNITVQAVCTGYAEIKSKGKIRRIMLPGKLCRKLKKYAQKRKIVSGEIFVTRNGTSMDRRQIWAELKRLCSCAKVESTKVFPHNFRHLFAVTYYKASKDVVRLADILGHSNVETTRIYLLASGTEHLRQMDRLGLVL